MHNCPFKEICNHHIDTFANYSEEFVTILQGYYCYGNEQGCARYHIGKNLGESHIPKNLKPHQFTEAQSMFE